MRCYDTDHLPQRQQQDAAPAPDVVANFAQRASALFRRPLVLIVLIWGLLFLLLGVTFVYAQDAAW